MSSSRPRTPDPELPDSVTGQELDPHVRHDLLSLTKDGAVAVSRHLVMVGQLLDTEPEQAWEHAQAARRRAGRVAVVREAAGLAAYRSGRYDEALRELRTFRRMSGSEVHLPVMADCERGLGRPERALTLAAAPEAARLDIEGQVEMRIVAAGARMDMGQPEAAVVLLQGLVKRSSTPAPLRARLGAALADALMASGREKEARAMLEQVAGWDPEALAGAQDEASTDEDAPVLIDLLDGEPDTVVDPGSGTDAAARHGLSEDLPDGRP